jgi:cytoskeletal protein CcmA (bactofilin family)
MKFRETPIPEVNMLSANTVVNGNMVIQGDFRLDGQLIGNIECSGKITIGPNGSIEGLINCKNAEISGEVKGNIKVIELIILKETSKITGDIICDKLTVEPGATLKINCITMYDKALDH